MPNIYLNFLSHCVCATTSFCTTAIWCNLMFFNVQVVNGDHPKSDNLIVGNNERKKKNDTQPAKQLM